jgi:hypothetical protein
MPRVTASPTEGTSRGGIINLDCSRQAYNHRRICYPPAASPSFNAAREIAMAKGQMRSNKEKKKPKADKNIKKGGAAPSPFSSGKTPAGQSPHTMKK